MNGLMSTLREDSGVVQDTLFSLVWNTVFLMTWSKTDGLPITRLHNMKLNRTCKMLVDWLQKDLDGWE